MAIYKRIAWEPDTCGCRLIYTYDAEADPIVHHDAIVERYCPAHQPQGDDGGDLIPWEDGNWKPNAAYLDYQREWFRWRTGQRRDEPATTGSQPAPSPAAQAERRRVMALIRRDNVRKNQAITALKGEGDEAPGWRFEGEQEARRLILTTTAGQAAKARVRAAMEIQFGPGAVTVAP